MNRYKMHTEATPDTAKKITCSIGSPTAVNGTETSVHCQVINSTCVSALKQKGNELLKESKPKAAIKTYTSALEAAAVEHTDDQERAVLLSNRAFAHITCRQYIQAEADARLAAKLAPTWPKPLHRLAQALQGQQRWEDAISACQAGMACSGATSDFQPLRDALAVQAALHGCYAGFPGRMLDVRDAGEEAWLGKEAPEDPNMDGPEDEPLLQLPPALEKPHVAPAARQQRIPGSAQDPANTLSFVRKGTSFRSVHAAMAAARDGDQIILRKGIHNGLGESVKVKKRVLIRGTGALGETRVDHRGNAPAFRIANASVLLNLDIDMTGYTEALKFEGTDPAGALVHECIIRCSGNDAVHMCEGASPQLSRCKLQAKHSGLWAFDKAKAVLTECTIEECGWVGVKLFDSASVRLHRCSIKDCGEDGIVAQDRARVDLEACRVTACKGPALDLTHQAQAFVTDSALTGCAGAVWVWDKSTAWVRSSQLQADATWVVLSHGEAHADIQVCKIDGKPYMGGLPQKVGLESLNSVTVPQKHIGVPAEEGAFEFVPNPYTRKQ